MKNLSKAIEALLSSGAHRATIFETTKSVVKATRRAYRGKFSRGTIEVTLTAGRPNYAERKVIKTLIKAGEPFPVKKAKLQFLKKKKK